MPEVRDPIHQFIELSDLELSVIDTWPMQRLREIHQLSTGFLIWPGAVHTRFEHALGTMELAGRAFDAAIRNARADNPAVLRPLGWDQDGVRDRARSFVRLAALLHDVGHSPFSHGPEELFPKRESGGEEKRVEHEDMSAQIILETEVAARLKRDRYRGADPDVIADIAVGPKHRPGFSDDTTILLTELVTGSVGVDRWDYLLRDSLFSGVRYGLFDIERLIESLTIIDVEGTPKWALKSGGQYSAEQMLLARWFMWLNVYKHKTRCIFDLHLEDYLRDTLPGGLFPTDLGEYLNLTDGVIIAGIKESPDHRRHILGREQFRQVGEASEDDFESPHSFRDFAHGLGLDTYRIDDFIIPPSLPGEDNIYTIGVDGRAVSVSQSLVVMKGLQPKWIGRIYVPTEDRVVATKMVNEALQARRQDS